MADPHASAPAPRRDDGATEDRDPPLGRRILNNIAGMGVFKALADASVLVMFVLIARRYGQDGLGVYSFAMAFTGFLALLGNFGFETYAVREVARDPAREARCFGSLVLVSALLGPLLFGGLLLLVGLLGFGSERSTITLTIGGFQILYFFNILVIGRFKARNRMATAGALEFGLRFAILAGVAVAVWSDWSLVHASFVFPGVALLQLVVAWVLLDRRYGGLDLRPDPAFLRSAWHEIWPFGVTMVLHAAYIKIDVLILGLLRDASEVGVYSAAFRPIFGFLTMVAMCAYAVYPVFSRLFVESKAKLHRTFERVSAYFVAGCGLVALWVVVLARPIVVLLYGPGFESTVPVFRLFGMLVLVSGLNVLLEPFLGAVNRQRIRMIGMVGSVLVNIGLNVPLVTHFGYFGALVATIVSEALLFVFLWNRLASAGHATKLPLRLLVAAAAVGAGALAWRGLEPALGTALAAAAATVVYAVPMLAFGGVRRSDLAVFGRWLAGRPAVPPTEESRSE